MDITRFNVHDNDKQITCEVVATYHDDDTNKNFIVYTDGTLTDDNKLKLYYSLYKNVENGIKLLDIQSSEDEKIGLQLVHEILNDLK